MNLLANAEALKNTAVEIRRDLHIHPELGFREVRTAGIVSGELNRLGLEVTTGVGKTGVVGLLDSGKPGPVVLLRVDMDALPIQEETGAGYASQNPGVMHACGHDGHVAIGLTVARLLSEQRDDLSGIVKFVFQPAEEGLGGAGAMIADGVLETPKPNYSLAVHVWNEKPVGWIGIVPGPLMAGMDSFRITVTGVGGHGAIPQLTHDPVFAAAQIISALQSIVSRNISPLQSAVVSVTQVQAGEAFNIIPQTAVLRGTIRTFEKEVHDLVIQRLGEVSRGVAEALGCTAEVESHAGTPAVINDPAVAGRLQALAGRDYPGLKVDPGYRTMVSEDMALMLQAVPGVYLMVGSANPERGLNYGHHHPRFDIDEAVLPLASAFLASAVLELMKG